MTAGSKKKAFAESQIDSGTKGSSFFKEHNPYWNSSLFNEVYLRNDLSRTYSRFWNNDPEFEKFHNDFHNFVLEQDVEKAGTWSESDTIDNWIVPIMEMLGWHDKCEGRQTPYIKELSLSVQDSQKRKTYRFDVAYVDEPKFKQYTTGQKDADDRIREARNDHTGIKMIVEAKYWDRLEQYRQAVKEEKRRSDVDSGDGPKALSPNDQILKYLDIVQNDFGILTDGKTWRLFHKDVSKGDVKRFYEFDLGNLSDLIKGGITNPERRSEFLENAKYFFYIFRKKSFYQADGSPAICRDLLEYSKKYTAHIEEDLKRRFIFAMGHACNAIAGTGKTRKPSISTPDVRNVAESHLFNILFIRSCETRKILPLHAPDYLKISLTEIVESLDQMQFDPEKDISDYNKFYKLAFGADFDLDGTSLFNRLMKLYATVHNGNVGFSVHGFKESIFTDEEWQLAKKCEIDNRSMLRIIFALNFSRSNSLSRKYQQIPYNIFTPRQLGSIYESLLEYRLEIANSEMVFIKNQWKVARDDLKKPSSKGREPEQFVKKGELFFSPSNEDRKITGAYYTPDYIVENIVERTLEPIVKDLTHKEILEVSVCDPAMGSGHFLNSSLQFLTLAYREAALSEGSSEETYEESARRVLEKCIFGVDLNPRAVKLAKMSLWLTSAAIGKRLEHLDDQLREGNSLLNSGDLKGVSPTFKPFDWEKGFPDVFKSRDKGFTAVVGNPPYIRIQTLQESQPYSVSKFEEKFKSAASGNYDIYVLFVELGLSLLRSDGRLGYIVPHKFMNSNYGEAIRKILKEEACVSKIVHFGDQQIFENATTYTCLLFLTKMPNKEIDFEKVGNLISWKIEGKSERGTIAYSSLPTDQWTLANHDDSMLLDKLKARGVNLDQVTSRIFQGIKTSADKIYIVERRAEKKGFYKIYSEQTESEFLVEQDLFHPLVKGGDSRAFYLNDTNRLILFPYAPNESGEVGIISPTAMAKQYPETWKYLNHNRRFLESRENGKLTAQGKPWYSYIYPKALNVIGKPKIFTPDIAPEPRFSFDHTGDNFFTGGAAGGYGVVPNNPKESLFLMAALNSSVTRWYIHMTSTSMRGGYYSYESRYITSVPIPKCSQKVKDKLASFSSKLVELLAKDGGQISAKTKDLRAKIDDVIFEAFELSAREIRIITKSESIAKTEVAA